MIKSNQPIILRKKRESGKNTTRNKTMERNKYRPENISVHFITSNETLKISQDWNNAYSLYPDTMITTGWNLYTNISKYQLLEFGKNRNNR